MIKLQEQLELITLKERIASNDKMCNRLINLLGQSKGWDELASDWKLSRSMVRGLKDMAICELCYTRSGFSTLRTQAYEEAIERLIHADSQRPIIIIIAPKANVELQYLATKPIVITAVAQGKFIDYSLEGTGKLETVQIKHDSNSPIFIFGGIISIDLCGQRVTECYFLQCQHLESICLSYNRIKRMEFHDSTTKLKNVDLTGAHIDVQVIIQMLSQVQPYTKQDLFDEAPILHISLDSPKEVYSTAKLKRWRVINTNNE